MKTGILLIVGMVAAAPALADTPLAMSMSLGQDNAKSTQPTQEYRSATTSATLTVTWKLGGDWFVTGVGTYAASDIKVTADGSSKDLDVLAGGVVAVKALAPRTLLNLVAMYGDVDTDSVPTVGTTYQSKSNSLTLGAGLTQIVPMGNKDTVTLGASLATTRNHNDSYTNATGGTVAGSRRRSTTLTLGTRYTWQSFALKPYASLQYKRSDKEFMSGVGDKDYFQYGLGLQKALADKSSLGLALTGITGKKHESGHGINLTYSKSF